MQAVHTNEKIKPQFGSHSFPMYNFTSQKISSCALKKRKSHTQGKTLKKKNRGEKITSISEMRDENLIRRTIAI